MNRTENEQKVLTYLIKQAKREWNEIYFKGVEKYANIDRATAYKTLKALGDANEITIKMVENADKPNYFKWFYSLPTTTNSATVEEFAEEVKAEQVVVVDDAAAVTRLRRLVQELNDKQNKDTANFIIKKIKNKTNSTNDDEYLDEVLNDAKKLYNNNLKYTLKVKLNDYKNCITPNTLNTIVRECCNYNLDYDYISTHLAV